MSFKSELEGYLGELASEPFKHRYGQVVPNSSSVGPYDAVSLSDTAYLYCDMADSSSIVTLFDNETAARVLRVFLNAVCRVIKDRGGEIRSFDGDRVMAIFIGDSAADDAVDAALRINWAVLHPVQDALMKDRKYRDKFVETGWQVKQRTGIEVGWAYIVRGGVRDQNDLVSIGFPANTAAKLSDYKGGGPTIITEEVWDKLKSGNCYSAKHDYEAMWSDPKWVTIGKSLEQIRTSTWFRYYS